MYLHTIVLRFLVNGFSTEHVTAIMQTISQMQLPNLTSLSFQFPDPSYLCDRPTLRPLKQLKKVEKSELLDEFCITSMHPINIKTIKSLPNIKELAIKSHIWNLNLLQQFTSDDCLFRSSLQRIDGFALTSRLDWRVWYEELAKFPQLQSFSGHRGAQTTHIPSLCQLPSLTHLHIGDLLDQQINQPSFDLLLHTIQTKWQIKELELSCIIISDSQLCQLIVAMKQTLERVTFSSLFDITSIHSLCQCHKLTSLYLFNLSNLSHDSFVSDLSFIIQQCRLTYLSLRSVTKSVLSDQHLPYEVMRKLKQQCDYVKIDDFIYQYQPLTDD